MARACRARSWVESSLTSGVRNGFSVSVAVAFAFFAMCSTEMFVGEAISQRDSYREWS